MYTKNRAPALKFVEYGDSQIEASSILTEAKKIQRGGILFPASFRKYCQGARLLLLKYKSP